MKKSRAFLDNFGIVYSPWLFTKPSFFCAPDCFEVGGSVLGGAFSWPKKTFSFEVGRWGVRPPSLLVGGSDPLPIHPCPFSTTFFPYPKKIIFLTHLPFLSKSRIYFWIKPWFWTVFLLNFCGLVKHERSNGAIALLIWSPNQAPGYGLWNGVPVEQCVHDAPVSPHFPWTFGMFSKLTKTKGRIFCKDLFRLPVHEHLNQFPNPAFRISTMAFLPATQSVQFNLNKN